MLKVNIFSAPTTTKKHTQHPKVPKSIIKHPIYNKTKSAGRGI
jgi:hypothetical protein